MLVQFEPLLVSRGCYRGPAPTTLWLSGRLCSAIFELRSWTEKIPFTSPKSPNCENLGFVSRVYGVPLLFQLAFFRWSPRWHAGGAQCLRSHSFEQLHVLVRPRYLSFGDWKWVLMEIVVIVVRFEILFVSCWFLCGFQP